MGVISPLLASKERHAMLQTNSLHWRLADCRTDGCTDACGSPGPCCSHGVRWDTSAGLSMTPAGTGDTWVCVWVKGTGWISQMLRALWHDLRWGKKRQIWLSYKQPEIPLTSAGAAPPFCRAEFDFESLGVQCQPFIHA